MDDLKYAYAVGRTRVKELSLLTDADFERLLLANSAAERLSVLQSKGYASDAPDEMLTKRHADACAFLREVLPEPDALACLFIENDFHAVKTAIRDGMTGKDSSGLLLTPAVYDEKEIYRLTLAREFDSLPQALAAPAREASDTLTRTGAAFLADSILDKACAKTAIELAKKTRSRMLIDYAEAKADLGSIKAVLRCARAGKDREAMALAAADCGTLDAQALLDAAGQGESALAGWLDGTDYAEQGQALRQSDVAFERSCDDRLTGIIERGKMTAFGVEPVAAYYLAAESELRTVRIILAAKQAGFAPETIRERIRLSYV